VVSPEGFGTSRLPSFTRRLAWEDRCFLLRCYRKPVSGHNSENLIQVVGAT
jgi:hypothetical protein